MQPAEKPQAAIVEDERDGETLVVYADKSKAPPAASLTSAVFQRSHDKSRGVDVGSLERQTAPEAPQQPEEPVGARAQQVLLEQAFVEPESEELMAGQSGFDQLEFVGPPAGEPETMALAFDAPAQIEAEPTTAPAGDIDAAAIEVCEPDEAEPEAGEPPQDEVGMVAPEDEVGMVAPEDEVGMVAPESAVPEFAEAEADEEAGTDEEVEPDEAAGPDEADLAAESATAATPQIARSELQNARESAANWRLRRVPSGGFWERAVRDASIFTIFFAVLVFVILQAM